MRDVRVRRLHCFALEREVRSERVRSERVRADFEYAASPPVYQDTGAKDLSTLINLINPHQQINS